MKRNYLSVCVSRVFIAGVAGVCATFALCSSALCQTSAGVRLPSISLGRQSQVTAATMARVDNAVFIAEDEAELAAAQLSGEDVPFRSAVPLAANLNLNNSGSWETLPSGDRLWRLRILSPGATDLCLHYDRWTLHKPCELYLYNDDRSQVLGPYTYIDNWDGTNVTPFTTGEAVTLEYLVPVDADQGELAIQNVLHGYRNMFNQTAREANPLDNYGDAMACEFNIRCLPAWQDEKHSVAMIFAPAFGRWCSGVMLNSTAQDGAANFLTADHCWRADISNWLFYFEYESPECNPTTDGPTSLTISNATTVARDAPSDFLLLRLSRPRPEGPFIPRFEGWDRNDIAPLSSTGVHHPAGDVKKGSYDIEPAVSDDWNGVGPNTHWTVEWEGGITEGGSSGSPLFDENHRVVGQLHGGASDCVVETADISSYGKIATSWEGDGTALGRLRDWLDPANTGATWVDAFQPVGPPNDSCGMPGVPLIRAVPYAHSGSTKWAAANGQSSSSPDVVYTLQFPCDYAITVSTCDGADFDTKIYVYRTTPDCDGSGAAEGGNDDFCGTRSQFSFTALSGHLYSVWVSGYASSSGNYSFSVTGAPVAVQPTGLCPGTTVGALPYFTFTDNYCAQDDHVSSCWPNGGSDVVYNWVANYGQQMRAKTCNTNFDTVLEVIRGGNCTSGGSSAGCNDDACGLGSSVSFFPQTGATYWFHIDGFNGAEGTTSFQLEAANDDCSSPFVLPDVPTYSTGDTRPARDDFATYYGASSKEVFFQYTSPTCQNLSFSTCGMNGFDTAVEIRTGGPCPGSTIVAINDDACGSQSNATWGADANRTYYIIVGGFYDVSEGPFWFNLETHPNALPHLGDVCTGIQIPALPFTDYGSTSCLNPNYTNCSSPALSPEIVYQFSLPTCQMVTVSLCGSDFDTEIGIFGGVCPDIAPLITCDDDNFCGGLFTTQSTASFQAEANTNYQILVHGFFSYYGNYALNVTGTPCVVAPDPIVDVVVQINAGAGEVLFNWDAPARAADVYHIYASPTPDDLFAPEHLYADVTGSSYACPECFNLGMSYFFGVIVENYSAANAVAPRDLSALAKATAVQGPTRVAADDPLFTPVAPPVPVKEAPTRN
ncbi:trypsin-like peptidase domain-containing protein [candidate division KSB1 bacterium]|nr:trypsin-like peptidase domain-containing protein [candidate division KSB1 bacterium]